jgi:hypothetical protein
MTDFAPSTEPDWTRLCKGSDLKELRGEPYVLREAEDPDSPWRSMATRHEGMFRDPETRTPFYYMTIEFYGGDAVRDGDGGVKRLAISAGALRYRRPVHVRRGWRVASWRRRTRLLPVWSLPY